MNQTINNRHRNENSGKNGNQEDTGIVSVHRGEGDLRQLNLSNNYLFVKVMEEYESAPLHL